jgi:predicted helicase
MASCPSLDGRLRDLPKALFEGICFADTLELAEGAQLSMFVEENTERVLREKATPIMVVIGNPPYDVGQRSENDNNKNCKYAIVDERVQKTYAKDSKASNKNALGDVYVKFFRWAVDRLQGREGVVCFVSNNSFVDQIAFDGMRKHLLQDFTHVYHLDLHGNIRKNPKLSGTTHNVFGITLGVGITIAIRSSKHTERRLMYFRVPEFWRKTEKLAFLAQKRSFQTIEWMQLQPDEDSTWLTERMRTEFKTFLPLGKKESKTERAIDVQTIFRMYGGGVKTNRDVWVYDFNHSSLTSKVKRSISAYNGELDRWRRRGNVTINVDNFVTYDDTKIKWRESLKTRLQRGQYLDFSEQKLRRSLNRPFCKQWLYFDRGLVERVYQFPQIFPIQTTELENVIIWLKVGSDWPMFALASNIIPDLLPQGGSQCFPFYTYDEDGGNRRENITNWALARFQERYGPDVTKWDIFHHVYALLHHPQYRERYAENLKRDLQHIPLLHSAEAFQSCTRIGKQLMELHLHYEEAKEYLLQWLENQDVPFSWRVEKMRLTPDRRALVVNESLTLSGIPPECFAYRLGNRSALEWVIDQYQVSQDKRSGIVSDPNNPEDEEYIVRLVGKVITVSMETVRLVNELAQAVTQEEWIGETSAV